MSMLKRFSSFLLLLLFLFPLAEKELHALEHAGDNHCTANEKHFHELEHSCPICEYTLAKTESDSPALYSCIRTSNTFSYPEAATSKTLLRAPLRLPARAPPVMC